MKKKFTLLLAAFMLLMVSAQAQSPLTFQWAHSVDGNTTAGDNVIGMAKSSDGNYYVATSFGSSSSQTNAMGVWIDGVESDEIEGSPYTGTSQNGNLVLQKVNKQGEILWTAYSDKGDVDHGATHIAATPDGGVVMALKVRAWVEEAGLRNLLEYVNPDGVGYSVTDFANQKGEYKYLIVKIDSDGNIIWCRIISGEVKTDTKYATKNNAYINGLALDEVGNIFLAGNFRTSLTFLNDDSATTTTLEAKNTSNWNGDSQAVVGDLFLVQLDSNGFYKKSLLADGTAKCAFFDKIVYDEGKLYLSARVQGDGTEMKLGGLKVDASNDRQTEILASVNASDLSVNYVKSLESVANTDNRFVIQNKSVQLLNGKLYYTGLLNGSWKQDGQTLLDNPSSKLLKGYVLQVDPATGHVDNAAIRLDGGIGGFFGVYEGQKNIYAFGYDFNGGAILAPISKDNFTLGTATKVCSYGTVGICTTPIVDGENFVLANRGGVARNFSNKASFYGTDFKFDNLKCWGTVYYSYKMGDVMTGVDKVTVDTNDDALVDVYTLNGMKVKSGVSAAEATQGLAKGIYIINHKKVVVK